MFDAPHTHLMVFKRHQRPTTPFDTCIQDPHSCETTKCERHFTDGDEKQDELDTCSRTSSRNVSHRVSNMLSYVELPAIEVVVVVLDVCSLEVAIGRLTGFYRVGIRNSKDPENSWFLATTITRRTHLSRNSSDHARSPDDARFTVMLSL